MTPTFLKKIHRRVSMQRLCEEGTVLVAGALLALFMGLYITSWIDSTAVLQTSSRSR